MTENKGDLISRSHLHKVIAKCVSERHGYFSLRDIKDAIDNAPAIDSGAYARGFYDGIKHTESLYKRPQGEWIFDREFTEFGNPYGTYRCSICGGHSSSKYSFCKDCGADMRKGDSK